MQIGKTTFFSQNILPEKEREHQKGAKIQANIIFGLRVRERKRRREWKEILLRNKKLWQANGSDIKGCIGGPLRPIHLVSCYQRRQTKQTISI